MISARQRTLRRPPRWPTAQVRQRRRPHGERRGDPHGGVRAPLRARARESRTEPNLGERRRPNPTARRFFAETLLDAQTTEQLLPILGAMANNHVLCDDGQLRRTHTCDNGRCWRPCWADSPAPPAAPTTLTPYGRLRTVAATILGTKPQAASAAPRRCQRASARRPRQPAVPAARRAKPPACARTPTSSPTSHADGSAHAHWARRGALEAAEEARQRAVFDASTVTPTTTAAPTAIRTETPTPAPAVPAAGRDRRRSCRRPPSSLCRARSPQLTEMRRGVAIDKAYRCTATNRTVVAFVTKKSAKSLIGAVTSVRAQSRARRHRRLGDGMDRQSSCLVLPVTSPRTTPTRSRPRGWQ